MCLRQAQALGANADKEYEYTEEPLDSVLLRQSGNFRGMLHKIRELYDLRPGETVAQAAARKASEG